jgi:thioesterase domain-containing protein
VGVLDGLFDFAGPVLSTPLAARIAERFGRILPPETLLELPTIEQIARRLGTLGVEDRAWASLVPLQPQGTKPPLVCVHPIGGSAQVYLPLAGHLGFGQPLYGLQAPDLEEQEGAAHPTIEEMAAAYLEELRSLWPRGPYLLAGASFGGMVAFEMAQILAQQGEEVPLLVLFDTPAPLSGPMETGEPAGPEPGVLAVMLARELGRQRGLSLALTPGELRGLPPDEQLQRVVTAVQEAGIAGPEVGVPLLRRVLQGHTARRMAAERYQGRPYPGRITLFRPREHDPEYLTLLGEERLRRLEDPSFGWGAFGAVEVHRVSGYHETMIAEPNVAETAAILASCIARACQADTGEADAARGAA